MASKKACNFTPSPTPPPEYTEVPAQGDARLRNPNPTANSAPPSFFGWGRPRFTLEPVKPVEVVRPTAEGYMDLVRVEYSVLSRTHPDVNTAMPYSFFSYYLGLAWWRRILVVKSLTQGLEPGERLALTKLEVMRGATLPPRVVEYLNSIGVCDLSDRLIRLEFPHVDFSGRSESQGTTGFQRTENGISLDDISMFIYAKFPIPGMLWSEIRRDVNRLLRVNGPQPINLKEIRPHVRYFPGSVKVVETPNILGYSAYGIKNRQRTLNQLRELGVISGVEFVPESDLSTDWLVSPTLLEYVSNVVATVYPTHGFSYDGQGGSDAQLVKLVIFDEGSDRLIRRGSPPLRPELEVSPARLISSVPVDQELNRCAVAPIQTERVRYVDGGISATAPWVGTDGLRLYGSPPNRLTSDFLIARGLEFTPSNLNPSESPHSTEAFVRWELLSELGLV